jgi:NAD+ synthase
MTMEELARNLADWVKSQVLEARCEGTVFGLSGGVDSSVVGALCKRAFPDTCLGVLMPCHSAETDTEDAGHVAQQLGIPTATVRLDRVLDALLDALPDEGGDPGARKLAEANLKPRLRMATLYHFANRHRYLVVGTGNRSEIAVGYCTKYGDAGVDILPLGNLLKSRVRDLARHLGIPGRVILKPPSAGLWEGQTDEGEMGLTYEELDCYLDTGEATEEVRRRVEALSRAAAHKMCLPPIPNL